MNASILIVGLVALLDMCWSAQIGADRMGGSDWAFLVGKWFLAIYMLWGSRPAKHDDHEIAPVTEGELPAIDHRQQQETQRSINAVIGLLDKCGVAGRWQACKVSPDGTVTHTLVLDRGERVAKLQARQDDIARALRLTGVRVVNQSEHGKVLIVGHTTPPATKARDAARFHPMMQALVGNHFLDIPIGAMRATAQPVVDNLANMPHMLVVGATSSGKSTVVHSYVCAIMERATPKDVQFLLFDPKQGAEFIDYRGLPYLLTDPVFGVHDSAKAMEWIIAEVDRRFQEFATAGVKDFAAYRSAGNEMPNIVVVVDELGDLMLASSKTFKDMLIRTAQKARGAGVNMILATQRPSANVLTGEIKANVPVIICLSVANRTDSEVAIGAPGAETLLPKGDAMLKRPGSDLARVQCLYLPDEQRKAILKGKRAKYGDREAEIELAGDKPVESNIDRAIRVVREQNRVSIGILKSELGVANKTAERLIIELEERGIVSPSPGPGKQRSVISD